MNMNEIIKGLLIAAPIGPEDARQAIALRAECGIDPFMGYQEIAESLAESIIDDCEEWDFLPRAIWEAIGELSSAEWAEMARELEKAISAEMRPWECQIAGMIADERKMAPIRERARIMLAEAPEPDWKALAEARSGKSGPILRPAARLLLALPIAWEMAPESPSLRRALAEQMADSPALCAIL